MKKNILLVVVLMLALTACGPKSKKGAWLDVEKTAAKTACAEAVKTIDASLAEDVATKACDCAVTKLEAEFESNADVAKMAEKATEIYNACVTENKPAPAPEPVAVDTTAAAAGDTTKKATEQPKK